MKLRVTKLRAHPSGFRVNDRVLVRTDRWSGALPEYQTATVRGYSKRGDRLRVHFDGRVSTVSVAVDRVRPLGEL